MLRGRGLDGLYTSEVSILGAPSHSGGLQGLAKQFNFDTLLSTKRYRCEEEGSSFLEVSILIAVTA